MVEDSLTITEFCVAERISRSLLYKLWAEGKGPRYYRVGSHRRISPEARTEWRRQLEAEAPQPTPTAVCKSAQNGVR